MPFSPTVVLHCASGHNDKLDRLVEQFVSDGVKFVSVVGEDCRRVQGVIDQLVVGDGSDEARFIFTSCHPGESLDQAVDFAFSLSAEYTGKPQIVEI